MQPCFRKKYVFIYFLMMWASILSFGVYQQSIISWSIVESNHRMYVDCQSNPEHRKRYHAPCLLLEQTKPPSNFFVDLMIEVAPKIYPFIFFTIDDILTTRGIMGVVLGYLVQKCIREILDLFLVKVRRSTHYSRYPK